MNKMNVSHPWHGVPYGSLAPRIVNAIIEIPQGARAKYEIDNSYSIIPEPKFKKDYPNCSVSDQIWKFDPSKTYNISPPECKKNDINQCYCVFPITES